jgi:hypothetical protein
MSICWQFLEVSCQEICMIVKSGAVLVPFSSPLTTRRATAGLATTLICTAVT